MGKIEQKIDGNYILDVKIGNVTVKKAFKDAEIPVEKIPDEPMTEGFFVNIPDIEE